MISLFAGAEREAKRQQLSDPLELLSRHIDFVAIAAVIDGHLRLGTGAKGGRPAWPTELMIRLLLLQQLYNLSDEALEYQVLDRRSFQRFLGLEHSGKVPDAKTIWVWRERLKKNDLIGDISAAVRGLPPLSRTLTRRPIEALRSVHVEAKEVQCGVQAWCG